MGHTPGRLRPTAFSPRPSAFRSCGFTILELIVALLVLGVGLVGIASLYGQAVQEQQDNDPRARAARLAQQMAERIKTNTAGRVGYASVVGVVCVKDGNDARPQVAAAQEAACWQDEIEEELPNGSGAVTRDTKTNPPTYVIAVSWSAAGSGAASYVMRVQPER